MAASATRGCAGRGAAGARRDTQSQSGMQASPSTPVTTNAWRHPLRSGWRHAFVVTGVLGLACIPLWLWVSRRAPAAPRPAQPRVADAAMLRYRRLWVFAAANALSMVGYFFWFFWTSKYMVDVYRLTLQQAAWYVWIPPVFACCGGFLGGWLSLRFCDPRRGAPGRALPRVPGGRRGFSGHCRPAVGDFARVGRGRNFA